MIINEHIECLQRVAARHSNDIIYFGHAAGSGIDEVYLIGEYVDETFTNDRYYISEYYSCKSDKF